MFQPFRHLLILLQAALLIPPMPACCCTWPALTGAASDEPATESSASGCCQKTLKLEEPSDVFQSSIPLICCTQGSAKPETLPESSCECCVEQDPLPVRDRVEGFTVADFLLTSGIQPVVISDVPQPRYSTKPMWTGPSRHVLHCVWRC